MEINQPKIISGVLRKIFNYKFNRFCIFFRTQLFLFNFVHYFFLTTFTQYTVSDYIQCIINIINNNDMVEYFSKCFTTLLIVVLSIVANRQLAAIQLSATHCRITYKEIGLRNFLRRDYFYVRTANRLQYYYSHVYRWYRNQTLEVLTGGK